MLGKKVRDKITGFEGVAVAKTEWLYGCIRYGVQGLKVKEDGTLSEAQWFDEPQLTEVEEVLENKKEKKYGQRKDPTRRKE